MSKICIPCTQVSGLLRSITDFEKSMIGRRVKLEQEAPWLPKTMWIVSNLDCIYYYCYHQHHHFYYRHTYPIHICTHTYVRIVLLRTCDNNTHETTLSTEFVLYVNHATVEVFTRFINQIAGFSPYLSNNHSTLIYQKFEISIAHLYGFSRFGYLIDCSIILSTIWRFK